MARFSKRRRGFRSRKRNRKGSKRGNSFTVARGGIRL